MLTPTVEGYVSGLIDPNSQQLENLRTVKLKFNNMIYWYNLLVWWDLSRSDFDVCVYYKEITIAFYKKAVILLLRHNYQLKNIGFYKWISDECF